jgi:transcriptional regulator with XRE-family HTH domain
MDYINNLKIAREEAGISKYKLSQITGIHLNHITKIEKGEVVPSIELYEKLLKACGRRLITKKMEER